MRGIKVPRFVVKQLRDICKAFQNGPTQSARDALALGNLLNEALDMDERHAGPDFEGMLGEVLEAVQTQGGRLGCALATREGVDAALVALSEIAPVLAPSPGDTQALTQMLREAVLVQTPTYRLVIQERAKGYQETVVTTDVIQDQPAACGLPRASEELELDDGRWGRVRSVRHKGASAIVTVLVHGHVQAEASN